MGVETSGRVDSSVRPATDRPDPSSTSSRQQQLRRPEPGRKTGPSKSALGPRLVGRTDDDFVGFVFVLSVPFLKKISEERKTGVSRLLVAITFDFLCQINFFRRVLVYVAASHVGCCLVHQVSNVIWH